MKTEEIIDVEWNIENRGLHLKPHHVVNIIILFFVCFYFIGSLFNLWI